MKIVENGNVRGEEKIMGISREKVDPMKGSGIYHVFTNAVNDCQLFIDPVKEICMEQMYRYAAFCCVEILTAEFLDSHFHLVVYCPKKPLLASLSDKFFINQCLELYGPRALKFKEYEGILSGDQRDKRARKLKIKLRKKLYARMYGLSNFMKEYKHAIARKHQRYFPWVGTLFKRPFSSVLVQPSAEHLLVSCAYVNLNAVKAGLVADPKDYFFSTYARAEAGEKRARRGYVKLWALLKVDLSKGEDGQVLSQEQMEDVGKARFRQFMILKGAKALKEGEVVLDPELVNETIEQRGFLAYAQVLEQNKWYLENGGIVAEEKFIIEFMKQDSLRYSLRRRNNPYQAVDNAVGEGLYVFSDIRRVRQRKRRLV